MSCVLRGPYTQRSQQAQPSPGSPDPALCVTFNRDVARLLPGWRLAHDTGDQFASEGPVRSRRGPFGPQVNQGGTPMLQFTPESNPSSAMRERFGGLLFALCHHPALRSLSVTVNNNRKQT
jgi:hypothetical protein